MPVYFHSEDTTLPAINPEIVKDWIDAVIHSEEHNTGEINIIFCTDSYLLEMNNHYLDRDHYTDVIAFDHSEKKIISGDVYISMERIKDNSGKYSVSFTEELCRVIIHGILHLLKYDDSTDELKKEMTKKENEYLALIPKNIY